MPRFAYAATRSDFSAQEAVARQPKRGEAPRRIARPAVFGFAVARAVVSVLLSALLLTLVGWGAARVLDSHLLGFVFADLVFLVVVALRNAVTDTHRTRHY